MLVRYLRCTIGKIRSSAIEKNNLWRKTIISRVASVSRTSTRVGRNHPCDRSLRILHDIMTEGYTRVWTFGSWIYNLRATIIRVYSQQLHVDECFVLTFPLRGCHGGHRLRNSLRKLAVDGGISCDSNK